MSDRSTTENPKEFLGREKDCIQYIPMRLILKLARVHKLGADKYGQKNWRVQPVRMSTYYNAMFRHMVEWFEGQEEQDAESKEHPLLHVIACALIILDGIEHKSIHDDRVFAEVKTGKLPAGSMAAIEDKIRNEVTKLSISQPIPDTERRHTRVINEPLETYKRTINGDDHPEGA